MVEEEEEEVGEGMREGMRVGIQNGGDFFKFCNFKKCEFKRVENGFQILSVKYFVYIKRQVEENI